MSFQEAIDFAKLASKDYASLGKSTLSSGQGRFAFGGASSALGITHNVGASFLRGFGASDTASKYLAGGALAAAGLYGASKTPNHPITGTIGAAALGASLLDPRAFSKVAAGEVASGVKSIGKEATSDFESIFKKEENRSNRLASKFYNRSQYNAGVHSYPGMTDLHPGLNMPGDVDPYYSVPPARQIPGGRHIRNTNSVSDSTRMKSFPGLKTTLPLNPKYGAHRVG